MPILMRRCDCCDRPFEHGHGGACVSCDRMLCGRHLFGGGVLWRLFRRPRAACVECRRGNRGPAAGPAPSTSAR